MRAAVRMSGSTALYNEDDVEALCLFALLVASCMAVALVLWFALTLISHLIQKSGK